MRRIKYTQNIVEEYLDLYSNWIKKNDREWKIWVEKIISINSSAYLFFPENLDEVLTASIDSMVAMFAFYYDHRKYKIIEETQESLKSLFNYDNWQPKIANFFMQHAEELDVHTCFYCETSYINKFESPDGKKRNHFDLDHFLPKALCPIVGLSIRNFIPSCAVCNEKLKKDHILGIIDAEIPILDKKNEIVRMCPSSDDYLFDSDVNIRIEPVKKEDFTRTLRLQNQPERYAIQFECTDEKSPYLNEIDLFCLEERYNYHKMEALRLYDLLNDYPPELLQKVSELFQDKNADDIKEDLFGLSFSSSQHRCFNKMKQDIAKLFKE